MKNKNLTYNISITAVMAALVFLGTFFLKIQMPSVGGYIHLGDAFIFIGAALLQKKYAVCSAVIGACLADLISGYAIWAPWTFIIKALMVLVFIKSSENSFISFKTILSLVIAGLINICGYYIAEAVIYGNWVAPIAVSAPLNAIQSGAAIVIFIIIGLLFKNTNLKKFIK